MTTLRLCRAFLAVTAIAAIVLSPNDRALSAEPNSREAASDLQPISFKVATTANSAPAPQRSTQRVRWTPNRRMGSARSTLSGGRRGQMVATCESGEKMPSTSLTLLVPRIEDGLFTTAAHPSFFWHVETSTPISARFILSDPKTADPIYTQSLNIQNSGISQIDLPAEVALEPGTRYRWTVLVACNGSGSQEVAARSFIERVSEPNLVRPPLSSSIEQAASYAARGIWYDALSSLIRASQQDPTNDAVNQELRSLLLQMNQPQIERSRFLEALNLS